MQPATGLVRGHNGRTNRLGLSTVRCGVALALLVSLTVLVLHPSGFSSTPADVGSHSNEPFLQGLPLPEFDVALGPAERFSLLFNSGSSRPSSRPSSLRSSSTNTTTPPAPLPRRTFSRLVVLPDLHGDGPQTLRALRLAGLVTRVSTAAFAAASVAAAAMTNTSSPSSSSGSGAEVIADTSRAGTAAAAAAWSLSALLSSSAGRGGDGKAEGEEVGFGDNAGGISWSWSSLWSWRWAGGDAALLQLGDVLDRGSDSLALLAWLEGLRVQARFAGGDVVTLLGNHELMNIHHDFRYISPAELTALASAGGVPSEWTAVYGSKAAEPAAGHRQFAGSAAGAADADADGDGAFDGADGHDGNIGKVTEEETELRRRAADNATEEKQEQEEMPLRAKTSGRQRAVDRELLHRDGRTVATVAAVDTASALAAAAAAAVAGVGGVGVGSFGGGLETTPGSVEEARRRLLQQQLSQREHKPLTPATEAQQQQHNQQHYDLLLTGMDIWRGALAADAVLGAAVRQRPLAAIVDAGGGADGGGCRILAVHACALPWMVRAVEKLLVGGPRPSSAVEEAAEGEAAKAEAALAEEAAASWLQPEHFVAAWNMAVATALRRCEGRGCRHRRTSGAPGSGGGDDEYERFRAALAGLLLGGEGAVWSRRCAFGPKKQVCGEVAAVARRLGVQRVVVGHTVQRGGRVGSRCGGQLILADVGVSRAIAGELAVLQCSTEGGLQALYGNGRTERFESVQISI